MIRVLDIDIDLFVDPLPDGCRTKTGERATDVSSWSVSRVRTYLSKALNLTRAQKLPGAAFETHEQLMPRLAEIAGQGEEMHLFHLDSHADLGIGQDCYRFYSDFLAYPLAQRRKAWRQFAPREGDFLLYALACGYVDELDYVTHPDRQPNDIPIGMDRWEVPERKGWIDLKRFYGTESDYGARAGRETLEKSIPLSMHKRDDFQYCGDPFSYLFVTRSPRYTPPESDAVFAMIRNEFICHG